MAKLFEVIIFTASIPKYANAIMDELDDVRYCTGRLYWESCSHIKHMNTNFYIKELQKIGRWMEDLIIVDNSPISYCWNTENALPIKTWTNDVNDIELYKYLWLLEMVSQAKDVR